MDKVCRKKCKTLSVKFNKSAICPEANSDNRIYTPPKQAIRN